MASHELAFSRSILSLSEIIRQDTENKQPPRTAESKHTASPTFSSARTHLSIKRSLSFGRTYEDLLDDDDDEQEDTNDEVGADEDTCDDPADHHVQSHDGSDEICFICEEEMNVNNLHRKHGLPLDPISEMNSEPQTREPSLNSADVLRRYGVLRHSHSAPEMLSAFEDTQSRDFGLLFPSVVEDVRRRAGRDTSGSDTFADDTKSQARIGSDDTLIGSSGPSTPPNGSPYKRLPPARSVPNLSPTKKMSDKLRDIARLLRGQVPTLDEECSPHKIIDLYADSFNDSSFDGADENLKPAPLSLPRDRNTSVSLTANIRDYHDIQASMPPARLPSPLKNPSRFSPDSNRSTDSMLSTEWPAVPEPLTVRNRSSFDTAPSCSSSRVDLPDKRARSNALLAPPQPVFFSSAHGDRQDTTGYQYTQDGIPLYNGSWAALQHYDKETDARVHRELAPSPDSCDSLAGAQSIFHPSPRPKYDKALDNFQRLRRSHERTETETDTLDDPFFDAPIVQEASIAYRPVQKPVVADVGPLLLPPEPVPGSGVQAVRRKSTAPSNLSLFPSPTRNGSHAMGLGGLERVRSLSSMLRIRPATDPSIPTSTTATTTTLPNSGAGAAPAASCDTTYYHYRTHKICPHGKSMRRTPRPTIFTGEKLNERARRRGLPNLFNSLRAHDCLRCEVEAFKGQARRVARSEGYGTSWRGTRGLGSLRVGDLRKGGSMGRSRSEGAGTQTQTRGSYRRLKSKSSSGKDAPVREWLCIPAAQAAGRTGSVNLGAGRGVVYMPVRSVESLPRSPARKGPVERCVHGCAIAKGEGNGKEKRESCWRCRISALVKAAGLRCVRLAFCLDVGSQGHEKKVECGGNAEGVQKERGCADVSGKRLKLVACDDEDGEECTLGKPGGKPRGKRAPEPTKAERRSDIE